MRAAILGASGLVGQMIIQVLRERGHEARGVLTTDTFDEEIVLSALPEGIAAAHLRRLCSQGKRVVDNSSAFRYSSNVPLVVDGVNSDAIGQYSLIASPNCVVTPVVKVLHKLWRPKERVTLTTYQSVSGAGRKALDGPLPTRLDFIGLTNKAGWTREEMKIRDEIRKIMGLFAVATCVRVPVKYGHSISMVVQFSDPVDHAFLYEALDGFPDDIDPVGTDQVVVDRIRLDPGDSRIAHLWIEADNLRVGAATNVVDIAEALEL